MSSRRAFSIRATTTVATSGLALILFAFAAAAQSSNSNYTFLIASGFLCDTGDSSACPAAANSVDGDSYEMSGAGVIITQDKSVTAAGTYTHKSREGTMLETGVWVASELVSFDSYGIAPGALPATAGHSAPRSSAPGKWEYSLAPCPQADWPCCASGCCPC